MEKHELIEHNIVILPVGAIDLLLKQDDPADLIALDVFYRRRTVDLNTNPGPASADDCTKALRWDHDRFHRANELLIDLGLIREVVDAGKKGGGK